MRDLLCIAFKERGSAEEVLSELGAGRHGHISNLEGAKVIIRDAGGNIDVKDRRNPTGAGAAHQGGSGGLWGVFLRLLFSNPLAGMSVCAAGAIEFAGLSGVLSGYGIDSEFLKSLTSLVKRNNSAIVALAPKEGEDGILPYLVDREATVVRKSLTSEQENRWRAALVGRGTPPQVAKQNVGQRVAIGAER